MVCVKWFRLLLPLGFACLLLGQLREGNFDIRFEPEAKLQTAAPIPYRITVRDDRSQPVVQADVTLRIETTDHQNVQTFKAPMLDPGMYRAKPVFSRSGQWNVTVDVKRNNGLSSRTITYTVPD